jgi:hypothetical protein
MNVNFNDQVLKTADFIISHNLSSLDLKRTSYQEQSCWGQICIALIKKFDRYLSLRLWKNWKFNIRGYRELVYKNLEKRGFKTFENNGNNFLNKLKLIFFSIIS